MGLAGCEPAEAPLPVLTGSTMGTTYRVTLADQPLTVEPDDIRQAIDERLDRLEDRLSTYRPESDISRFNQAAPGPWIEVAEPLVRLARYAKTLYTASGGAFDPTVGPLVNLWGFGPEAGSQALPTDQVLAQARGRVGMTHLQWRDAPPALRKSAPVYLDYSAIAKGYGVDVVAELLEARELGNFLVEIGGELVGRGHKPGGEPWRVAIEQPVDEARQIGQVLRLPDRALATSGDYRNFRVIDGKRYSHTIDPRTGYPVGHDLHSVSVLADSCLEADGLATMLLVMGPQEGLAYARKHGLAALFISGEQGAYTKEHTDSFAAYMEKAQ